MAKKKLGELLLERGLIDNEQLNSALGYQRQWGYRLGAVLVLKGFVSEGALTRVLSESLQVPMVDLSKVPVDPKALQLLKPTTAEEYDVLPIAVKTHQGRKTLLLAMADPLNVAAIDEIAFTTDMAVRPAIAQLSSLEAAIKRYYRNERVDIPPLKFGITQTPRPAGEAGAAGHDDEDRMVITVGGSEREIVATGVVDLSKTPQGQQPQNSDFFSGAPTGAYMMALPSGAPGSPFQPQPTGSHAFEPQGTGAFRAQPTVNYRMPAAQPSPAPSNIAAQQAFQPQATGNFPMPPMPMPMPMPHAQENVELEQLEQKFWALMRILARKGLITKEEFLKELKQD